MVIYGKVARLQKVALNGASGEELNVLNPHPHLLPSAPPTVGSVGWKMRPI